MRPHSITVHVVGFEVGARCLVAQALGLGVETGTCSRLRLNLVRKLFFGGAAEQVGSPRIPLSSAFPTASFPR